MKVLKTFIKPLEVLQKVGKKILMFILIQLSEIYEASNVNKGHFIHVHVVAIKKVSVHLRPTLTSHRTQVDGFTLLYFPTQRYNE